jgi:DNA-binding MarR family transcriptional regulator
MSTSVLLNALADALAAASATLRQHAAVLDQSGRATGEGGPLSAVERARIVNPLLGPRQAQILGLLEEAHPEGTDTGKLGRGMGYDQANVYLTLKGLTEQGLVEKDTTTRPHRYRLAADFLSPGDH